MNSIEIVNNGWFSRSGGSGKLSRLLSSSFILIYILLQQSVVMPVYNAENWLQEALESVCKQTFSGSLELSVFNDASTVSLQRNSMRCSKGVHANTVDLRGERLVSWPPELIETYSCCIVDYCT